MLVLNFVLWVELEAGKWSDAIRLLKHFGVFPSTTRNCLFTLATYIHSCVALLIQ